MSDTALMIVDEFVALLDDTAERDLIGGRLRERSRRFHTPAHAGVAANLCHALVSWRETRPRPRPVAHGLGAGFLLRRDPDTLIGCDLSVASAEQMASTPRDRVYFDGPPLLAVEILEPSDSHGDVVERVEAHRAAGAVIWIVDPESLTVTVHRPGRGPERLDVLQEIKADPYLPGFRVAVAKVFGR